MLVSHERFAQYAKLPMADPATHTLALFCFSVSARDEVDTVAEAALAAGGTEGDGPEDHGFMYTRSFFDLDGHGWQVMWMDPAAAQQGPGGSRSLHAGRRRPGLSGHHVRRCAGWPRDVVVQAGSRADPPPCRAPLPPAGHACVTTARAKAAAAARTGSGLAGLCLSRG